MGTMRGREALWVLRALRGVGWHCERLRGTVGQYGSLVGPVVAGRHCVRLQDLQLTENPEGKSPQPSSGQWPRG